MGRNYDALVAEQNQFTLRAPEGRNKYCGPTAIAALTGATTDQVEEIVLRYRRARLWSGMDVKRVTGMTNPEMEFAFSELGYHAQIFDYYYDHNPDRRKPTLKAWHRAMVGQLEFNPRLIVEVTRHYVAVHGDTALCSLHEHRAPRHIAYAASARRRVCRAWMIVKKHNEV